MAVEKQPLPGAVVHYCIAIGPHRIGPHRGRDASAVRTPAPERTSSEDKHCASWKTFRVVPMDEDAVHVDLGSEKGLLRSDRTSSSLRGDGNTSQSSPAMSRQGRFMRATKGAAHPCRWHLPVKCIPIRPQVARHRAHRDSRGH